MGAKRTEMPESAQAPMAVLELDVVIIGAGISGIDAAYHLKTYSPNKTFAILEKRNTFGGTWRLFTYPGLRSDSEMLSFGFGWKPWTDPKTIATADTINAYLSEAVSEQGLSSYMRLGDGVQSADWCAKDQRWNLRTEQGRWYQCKLMVGASGYYHHDSGYTPQWDGMHKFNGQIVHPQQWDNCDTQGKRVVVIGSGATAVTIVPSITNAAKVTMLQRSPSYIVPAPSRNQIASSRLLSWTGLPLPLLLRRALLRLLGLCTVTKMALLCMGGRKSAALATAAAGSLLGVLLHGCPTTVKLFAARWYSILYSIFTFWILRAFPAQGKANLLKLVRDELPEMPQAVFEKHFTPKYNPWEQRLCVCPDGDFYAAIRQGTVEVVTDQIVAFTENGILLREAGEELLADVVVTATGLRLPEAADAGTWWCSGIEFTVDGAPIIMSETTTFQGVMLSGVPNFVYIFGYTNSSWTLRADLISKYICRMLDHLDRHGYKTVTPQLEKSATDEDGEAYLDLNSGYILRSAKYTPKQGAKLPWRFYQNYVKDYFVLAWHSLDAAALRYT